MSLVFDIETGGLPDVQLAAICPPFDPPPPPGEFDPASVKVGNLGPEKAAQKIANAISEHNALVENYAATCDQAAREHFADFKSRAALDPTTGRVLAIGFQAADDPAKFAVVADDSEPVVLMAFWEKYLKCRKQPGGPRKLVGCNIFGFDLPFLVRRSWMLGVDVPTSVRPDRYWDSNFIDIRDRWLLGQRWGDCSSSLDVMARALGCGQKPEGVNGGDFARLWETDRTKALEYLKNDLAMTAAVARRLGVA